MREALIILLLAVWAYFSWRVVRMVAGGAWVVSRATGRARAGLRREVAALTTDDVRTRLVQNPYFTADIRSQASVQQFLSRVSRHEEIALAAEYPRRKMYRLLANAEAAAGRTGRPEAVDAIDEIWILLEELARRAAG